MYEVTQIATGDFHTLALTKGKCQQPASFPLLHSNHFPSHQNNTTYLNCNPNVLTFLQIADCFLGVRIVMVNLVTTP